MRGICQTGESSGNSAMGWTGETGEGSRSEVRGFRNFELRTSTSDRAFLATAFSPEW